MHAKLCDDAVRSSRNLIRFLTLTLVSISAFVLTESHDAEPYERALAEVEELERVRNNLWIEYPKAWRESADSSFEDEVDRVNTLLGEAGVTVTGEVRASDAFPFTVHDPAPISGSLGDFRAWFENDTHYAMSWGKFSDEALRQFAVFSAKFARESDSWEFVSYDDVLHEDSGVKKYALKVGGGLHGHFQAVDGEVSLTDDTNNGFRWAEAQGDLKGLRSSSGEWLPESRAIWSLVREFTPPEAIRVLKERISEERETLSLLGITFRVDTLAVLVPVLTVSLLVVSCLQLVDVKLNAEREVFWLPLSQTRGSLPYAIVTFLVLPVLANCLVLIRAEQPKWLIVSVGLAVAACASTLVCQVWKVRTSSH